MKNENVILVDELDNALGIMEKMEAHRKGKLHRAFSVFIFNSDKKLLIHQRAHEKYHSGGLWTNTCCSHPRPGEFINDAAHRRLREEMGFDCEMKSIFSFIYCAQAGDLIEHELDHVFIGIYNKEPKINREEVVDYKWLSITEIKEDLASYPDTYSSWFKIIFERLRNYVEQNTEIFNL